MTASQPKLLIDDLLVRAPRCWLPGRRAEPEAVVLVLHGGRESSTAAVRANQLAVLRQIPFARAIARHGRGRVVLARLRFRVRGWNATGGRLPSPVADAEWALQQLSERFSGLPFGLVGHSMGGRTALRVAGHPQVRGVVGLAPWLPPGEPIEQLAGRQVLLMHGTADRWTNPAGSAAFADRMQAAGMPVSLVRLTGERHSMLGRPQLWHELTAQFVLNSLLADPHPSGPRQAPNFLHEVAGGSARITY